MKRRLLSSIQEKIASFSKTPWASFETEGPDAHGRVGFSISWNDAFIKNLHQLGLMGHSDEETVQMFFLSARMVPEKLEGEEDVVNPEGTPELTSEANSLRR